ncbi:MAG: ABC transporter ATP-binding protein [Corallococcus sp.]|nr:ABC transporter ATP-binding protein [Bacillota bacterium]MCM1533237.1 ABC transporter ATP-binding protein [Corallococcus sp.]
MADVMISTTGLTKVYNNKTVVNNVGISIERGEIVGLVGQNGAGKTTLIRMLTGLVKPTSGSFELMPGQTRKDTDVAAIVERPSIYSNMTALDNLIAQSKLLDLPTDLTYLETTVRLVGLDPNSKKLAKNFSLGMKQRLAIAMTMVGRPQLLILDEPTNGLDPQGIFDMREIFVRINKELGTTLLVSSHILSELSKFATVFYIMDKGNMIKRVTLDEIKGIGGKRIVLKVDKTDAALTALREYGDVRAVSAEEVELVSDAPMTQIMLTLAQKEITVFNIAQKGDSLEDYYLDIINRQGASHIDITNGGAL